MRRRTALGAACLLAAVVLVSPARGTAQSSAGSRSTLTPALDSAKTALAKYQNPLKAVYDGYHSTVACAHFPEPGHAGTTAFPAGAMGVHLLNFELIGKPLDPTKPQVLIYEPVGDTLRLVAAEWFVPIALSPNRPQLFGRPLDGPMDGHEPIMPAALRHWDLHVWLWKDNPAGMFSPTNPALKCPASVNTVSLVEKHH